MTAGRLVECIAFAANLDGDSDSIASIAGQLQGAATDWPRARRRRCTGWAGCVNSRAVTTAAWYTYPTSPVSERRLACRRRTLLRSSVSQCGLCRTGSRVAAPRQVQPVHCSWLQIAIPARCSMSPERAGCGPWGFGSPEPGAHRRLLIVFVAARPEVARDLPGGRQRTAHTGHSGHATR